LYLTKQNEIISVFFKAKVKNTVVHINIFYLFWK